MRNKRGNEEAPVTLFSFQDIVTSLSGIMIFLVLMLAVEVVSRQEQTTAPQTHPAPAAAVAAGDDAAALAALRAESARLDAAVAAARAANQRAAGGTPLEAVRRQVAETREAEALRPALNRAQAQQAAARTALDQATQERERVRSQASQLQARVAAQENELARSKAGKRVFFIPEKGANKTPWLVQCTADSLRAGRLGQKDAVREFATGAAGEKELLAFVQARQPDADAFVILMKPSGVAVAMRLVNQIQTAGFDVGYDALEEDSEIVF